jgi:hypothetical protein
MGKGKDCRRKSVQNVAGLVLFSAGIGMVTALLMPGVTVTFTFVFVGVGGYFLFFC